MTGRSRHILAAAAILLLSFPFGCGAQRIAVKANALYWALMTPDLGLEVITGERTSVSLSAFGHYKPYGIDSKLFVVQPEFRYWFNGRPLTREFLGATAAFAGYDNTLGNNSRRGGSVLLGITGGYVFYIGKKWNLELSAGASLMYFRQYQKYVEDDYESFNQGFKFFPCKLAVTFIYIIK